MDKKLEKVFLFIFLFLKKSFFSYFFLKIFTKNIIYKCIFFDKYAIKQYNNIGFLILQYFKERKNEKKSNDVGMFYSIGFFYSGERDRKSTRLNSSHANISYAVFCLKKKNKYIII